ncbi:hypothetical protein [Sphingobacterium rhinopitheci]|uniref:hypothetical protein n=1 Tax=Sphingobacterium rhinopitheci TaxID=2781960 RepID=UPI001F517744|nr:hypothetical protein [Sphingobacterium rhinopitheci]MCI0922244.1 hypothetical protein [Sphingobacterium rhinopitheci]
MLQATQRVIHKFFSNSIHMFIIEVVKENVEDPDKAVYKCRYYFNGIFHTDDFLGIELEAID